MSSEQVEQPKAPEGAPEQTLPIQTKKEKPAKEKSAKPKVSKNAGLEVGPA
jgi:hypothetical protein